MQEETNIPASINKHPKLSLLPRKKSDELLKGAFEDNFFDFISFIYPEADQVLDFSRGVNFMDKELFAIIPDRERRSDKRVAEMKKLILTA